MVLDDAGEEALELRLVPFQFVCRVPDAGIAVVTVDLQQQAWAVGDRASAGDSVCARHDVMVHYHKRSNVESAFSMLKAKFGDSVMSKSPVGQANEVLCKVLCHNVVVVTQAAQELGVEADFGVALPA